MPIEVVSEVHIRPGILDAGSFMGLDSGKRGSVLGKGGAAEGPRRRTKRAAATAAAKNLKNFMAKEDGARAVSRGQIPNGTQCKAVIGEAHNEHVLCQA